MFELSLFSLSDDFAADAAFFWYKPIQRPSRNISPSCTLVSPKNSREAAK